MEVTQSIDTAEGHFPKEQSIKETGRNGKKVGWLIVLGLTAFVAVFQSISGRLPVRGRKKREMIKEDKMSKQPLPAPMASAVGTCHTIIDISRTPQHWKFTQHHRIARTPRQKGIAYARTDTVGLSKRKCNEESAAKI